MQIHSDGQKWTDQPKTPTYICSEISQHLFLSFKNLNATYWGKGKCGMTACFYGWICWVMPKNRIWIFLIFVGMNANILEKCGFSIGSSFVCVLVFCDKCLFVVNASQQRQHILQEEEAEEYRRWLYPCQLWLTSMKVFCGYFFQIEFILYLYLNFNRMELIKSFARNTPMYGWEAVRSCPSSLHPSSLFSDI